MLNSCLARIALTVACFALPATPPADLTSANSRKVAPDFALSDDVLNFSAPLGSADSCTLPDAAPPLLDEVVV